MSDSIISAPPKLPSNAKFGWFFAALFAFVAAYSYWKDYSSIAVVAVGVAALFAATTLVMPQVLTPLNHIWYRLGMLLGKIISPIVLGLIFFVLITPVSLATRLFGRDELKLKKRAVQSYWVNRTPPGPPSDSFKNQY